MGTKHRLMTDTGGKQFDESVIIAILMIIMKVKSDEVVMLM